MITNKNNLEEPIKEARKAKRRRRTKKYPFSSITYTTGDIGLNIDRFNTAMGTAISDFDSDAGESEGGEGNFGGALAEAKRYVRRYYIRPQNIFCSNKAEVLKALVDYQDSNFTVYSLNNLEDNSKDVSKLMNRDIIYYYDNGVLYDKNRVRVLDYDLSIKKEEDRKKLASVDVNSKEFKDTYEDRMTSATELEEAFNLEFDSYNAFGENLTEAIHRACCICGEETGDVEYNPEPYMGIEEGRACQSCYIKFVMPLRIEED